MAQAFRIAIDEPYRLDLTVAVLRRFSTNVVDVMTADGVYVRAFSDSNGPALLSVRQRDARSLEVTFTGPARDRSRDLAMVRRVIGADTPAPDFENAARTIPWLRELIAQTRGVRAPRYATLWEACVNAIVFQAVSLFAATAVLKRVILALSSPLAYDASTNVYPFPEPSALASVDDVTLRAAGLSFAKIAALRAVASAIIDGRLSEAMLEPLSTPEASARLCTIRGIGPWTAAVILLRGFGRIDQFPMNDSGVARLIVALGGPDTDLESVLAALGDQRGMLYYYLLLGRLIASGEVIAIANSSGVTAPSPLRSKVAKSRCPSLASSPGESTPS